MISLATADRQEKMRIIYFMALRGLLYWMIYLIFKLTVFFWVFVTNFCLVPCGRQTGHSLVLSAR